MNKFITRTAPLTPKRPPQKRPIAETRETNDENAKSSENVAGNTKKAEEPSVMEKLHNAIRENDAQFTFDLLSQNRPFDHAMNKTMTKMEFAPSYSDASSEFVLLSVDESVVSAFQEGQSLTIRGESTDDAVLCTDTATFPFKLVESATTVLLMNKMLEEPVSPTLPNFEVKIIDGKCYATGELCPPVDVLNIGRLKDMLREKELKWNWKEREEEEKRKGYRFSDLLESAQMSVGEMRTALADLPVIKFPNGRYRYLSHNFRGEMFGLIFKIIDEDETTDVTLESITFSALRTHLPDNVPNEVISWFLASRCRKSLESEDTFKWPEETIIRDTAVVVLHNIKKMQLQKFKEIMAKIVPLDLKEKLERSGAAEFEGVADISDGAREETITYLAPEDLPDTVKERMQYLFEHRRLWSMEQLRPYFCDLFKSKVPFDKFVVQNCDYTLSETNEMLYCGVRN